MVPAVLALLALVVEGVRAYLQLGAVHFAWMLGGSIAVLTPLVLLLGRSWSRVGADGITICWGLGHGRTYPWHEIRWIDVRENRSRGTSSYAVRMFLAGGRRRSLPGLYRTPAYAAPDFEENFQRVVDWWELSTDQATRVRPPRQFRDRLTSTVIVLALTLGFVVVTFVVFGIREFLARH